MGQYFKLVNPDREEYVDLPGPMKAIERLTNPIATAALGFLLLEGPQDGTAFLANADPDDPQLQDGISDVKAREGESERKRDRKSVYRKRDPETRDRTDEWDEHKIARVAASDLAIDEANDYAGRWAGDDVRLVGDYADNNLYGAMYGTVVAETDDGETVEYDGSHPNREVPCRAGTDCCDTPGRAEAHHYREDAEPGDSIGLRSADCEADFGTFLRYEKNGWADITEGLMAELEGFVGESFFEDREPVIRPDMVLQ